MQALGRSWMKIPGRKCRCQGDATHKNCRQTRRAAGGRLHGVLRLTPGLVFAVCRVAAVRGAGLGCADRRAPGTSSSPQLGGRGPCPDSMAQPGSRLRGIRLRGVGVGARRGSAVAQGGGGHESTAKSNDPVLHCPKLISK